MTTPLISIVVPVYNVAEYLPRCMDSLLAQDYPNIEIILVDDGSTDNSLEICRSYESDRVRVFSVENGGAASARNYGIGQCARESQYLAFVDSDDSVEPGYISRMAASVSQGCNLVVCSMIHIYNDCFANSITVPLQSVTMNNIRHSREFAALLKSGIMNPPWNKLFRLDIIRENNLRFKDMRSLEDIDFVFNYIKHCSSVRFISEPLYNYIHRAGTESGRVATDIYDNYMILHREMLDWFDKSLENEIHRFVYPQYLAVTLRYMRINDFSTPLGYLGKTLVKKAFAAHKCSSIGETGLHTLIRLRLLGLAKRIFLR
ncbi:MAG: glycosyltransferase [Duncaniella sp.]|nr:glycosyltransferase [Duncaniella sp.]